MICSMQLDKEGGEWGANLKIHDIIVKARSRWRDHDTSNIPRDKFKINVRPDQDSDCAYVQEGSKVNSSRNSEIKFLFIFNQRKRNLKKKKIKKKIEGYCQYTGNSVQIQV
jgi:hypothetical protein